MSERFSDLPRQPLIADHPHPDFETVRREYRESVPVQAPEESGQMVDGRHEAVEPLGPQDGQQPPQAQ